MASPWHDIYPEQRGVVSDPHGPARSVLLCLSCGRLPPHSGSEAVCPACAPPTGSCDCPGCVLLAAEVALADRLAEALRRLIAAAETARSVRGGSLTGEECRSIEAARAALAAHGERRRG